jgi:hypothetical protein
LRNTHRIDKQDEEAMKLQSREHRQKMGIDYDQIIYQHAQARRQKKKKKGTTQKLNQTQYFTKEDIFTKAQTL